MISVLVISHNQSSYLVKMIEALAEQLPSLNRLFVLDRCTDNSVNILTQTGESFVIKSSGTGFEAGASRDYGLGFLPQDDILFLDGDRIPHNLTEDLLAQASQQFSICLIKVDTDYRTWFSDEFSINPNLNSKSSNVVSCGMLISRQVLDKIKQHNQGRVFHEAFDGNWGCEDDYIGYLANHLNIPCGGFPKTTHVEGIVGKPFADWEEYQQNGFKINRAKLDVLSRLLQSCQCELNS